MSRRLSQNALGAALLLAASADQAVGQWSSDSLSLPRQAMAPVTYGGVAFFAGGRDLTVFSDVIDIYNSGTESWSDEQLSSARMGVQGVAVGKYVLFAGGATTLGPASATATIDVFDVVTQDWSTTSLPKGGRVNVAATTVGTKAIFAGGSTGGPFNMVPTDVVDIYDSALGDVDDPGAWTTATLSQARGLIAGATVGDLAIFAGGALSPGATVPTVVDTVDIYNSVTGAWSTANLSQPRIVGSSGVTTAGTKVYFAGGTLPGGGPSDVVDIYDTLTDSWTTEVLSEARQALAAVTVGDLVVFAGGFGPSGTSDVIDVLEASTCTWRPTTSLNIPRGDMGATVVGGRAVFAGGADGPVTDLVEFYEPNWTNLGGGTAGAGGQPVLNGGGSLVGGTSASISLTNAPAAAPMLLWLSLAPSPFAVIGGTMHASPNSSQFFFLASGAGSLTGSVLWPLGIPPDTQIWFQFIVQDPTSMHGLTLSNGLLGTTP